MVYQPKICIARSFKTILFLLICICQHLPKRSTIWFSCKTTNSTWMKMRLPKKTEKYVERENRLWKDRLVHDYQNSLTGCWPQSHFPPSAKECSFPLLLISKACRLQKKSNDAEKNWSQGNVDDVKIFVELAVVASRAHLPATEESLQVMRITYHPPYINSTQLTLTRVSN